MGRDTIAEMYHKDYLYKKAMTSKDRQDWWNFRKRYIEVKKLIQNAKKEYVKDQLEQNQNNPRKFWRNDNDISFLQK